ncbi:PREDICTED: uncharacterized protein LOC104804321 [Tarenaya hassleriana]|uniref:uncharacterized protein LOC104804321 n=1 Tax=Tarenaya hassleriana TaxID=28532 RepID=UPI00053C8F25|nr:PREDICTED: uncharacterized protein LOC104804321 [Tarenaya hassleriana]
MGCVASKLEEEEEVVSICRERKRLIKLAVERRYALADAHCRYCQSLYAVSAAIKLFVARHSSPPSPFLITFPPPCPSPPLPPSDHQKVITNPMFLQQAPSEANHEAVKCRSSGSSTPISSEEEEEEEEGGGETRSEGDVEKREGKEQPFGYFYMQMPPPMPSPQRDFGWDFFYPFDTMRTEVVNPYQRCLSGDEDDHLRVVREQEGIPDLEEEGEEKKMVSVEEKCGANTDKERRENNGDEMVKMDGSNGVNGLIQTEQKGLTVIDNPEMGIELLDALKGVEGYFVRAYNSGKDVSRMLEANMTRLESGTEEIRENSTKLIQAIAWHRSTSLKPSSCKSLAASSSKSSSMWTEYSNDLFDDYGGMDSGSHSLTLGRIYAWEKKLFEEVKAGDSTRKIYEKKCARLINQDAKGYEDLTADKTRASVKDLYARILVAVRSAETISKRIQDLRDEELQPQIIELLKGLTQTWRVMMESHETQSKIVHEVKTFACPSYGKFCNDSHRLATLQLEAELLNWRECFTKYVSAQRAYVEALHGWLSKFLVPEVEFYSRGRGSGLPIQASGPPLLIMCRDWLSFMEKLPHKGVAYALKSFSKDVRALWTQQGEEQQQKRKVDGLAKELDRRTGVSQKVETRLLEFKPTEEEKSESEMEKQSEWITEKNDDQLNFLREKLEMEKEKHHNYMQETQRITLGGFQTGFAAVFESVTEFSKASLKMYSELVAYGENVRKAESQSCIEGGQR